MPAVNKYKPHLFIVPEDDADRQIANGFLLHYEVTGEIQVVGPAGGWLQLIKLIEEEYVHLVRSNPETFVIGIIDCDNREHRIAQQLEKFPVECRDRIFLIGSNSDPEAFRNAAGMHFEKIGEKLADECFKAKFDLWEHDLLSFSSSEISRAKTSLREVVFKSQ